MGHEAYSKAVMMLLKEGSDTEVVLHRLKKTLQKSGRAKLLPRILTQLLTDLERTDQDTKVTVRVAREGDEKKHRAAIADALDALNCEGETETRIDPQIIGGYSIETKDKKIDATYKQKLLSLYQAIIN